MKTMLTQKIGSFLGILVVTFIWVAMSTTSAHANMAAGVTISNTANVDWFENPGAPQPSNPVNVTVNLVPGLAWDDPSLSTSNTFTVVPGATVTYTMDLLNTGNGSTLVALTDNTPDPGTNLSNDESFSTSTTDVANDLTLLGTVASGSGAAGAGTTWVVPVYNLVIGDLVDGVTLVHINGTTGTYYSVITAGSNATTLVIETGGADPGINTGDQIGEVINITYSGTVAASLTVPSLPGTHDHALTAASGTASDQITSDGTTNWFTQVVVSDLTITKYVRNVDTLIVGATTPEDVDATSPYGTSHYQTGVTGNPGETLEYLVIISNGGSGAATDVIISDSIPVTYVTFDSASVNLDTDGDGTFNVTDAVSVAGDKATWASPALTVYAGVGGTVVAPPLAGGAVAAGTTTAIIYQVTIQ